MQPFTGFVSLYPCKLVSRKADYHRSKRFILSRKCPRFGTHKPGLGTVTVPDQYGTQLDEFLRDLRTYFGRHYETYGNPKIAKCLRYSLLVATMQVDDIPDLPNRAISDQSIINKRNEQILRLHREAQLDSDEDYEVIERLFRQTDLSGSVKRRNAFFLGIPYKYLRAHEAFHALPTSLNMRIDGRESLTSLRQDCRPFEAVWQTLPLYANEVWPLLGFGEANPIALCLPPHCRGHAQALNAWQRLFYPTTRVKKRSFNQRFVREHVGNASLSYISAERTRWHHLARVAPPWCEAVQLLETGCYVSKVAPIPLAAAPVARVARRNEDDFWMWAPIDTILIAKTEHMYSQFSAGECRLKSPQVRSELDLLSWIEAQFSMLCCGENIRFADVVWYATLGGSSVFRVKRDDAFLRAGLQALERFIIQFVEAGCPPHSGFERGCLFSSMAQRIKVRSETTDRLSYDNGHVAETRLMPWRRRMNDWEQKRSQNRFFQVET